MPPHRRPQPFLHVSSEALEKAFHPYDKLVIGLPPSMASWKRAYGTAREWISLPHNPLRPGHRRDEAESEAAPSSSDAQGRRADSPPTYAAPASPARPAAPATTFYCDACQRDFPSEERYAEHMKTHIFCTVPGCHFTCRADRAYRMEEHMDTLHNRPDAPNLADTGAYLDQRKRRFPTQEAVKDKVEELFYKAARGVVLPEERRRWLKQHGVDVRKRGRSETAVSARGGLPTQPRSPSVKSDASGEASSHRSPSPPNEPQSQARPPTPPAPSAPEKREEAAAARPRFIQPPTPAEDPTAAPVTAPASTSPGPAASSAPTAAPAHPPKIIPLGPNGTLTPRQRVQLVRERYASAKDVPQFYVCHRCGKKGDHWVDDCPTKGDATYNRHVVWGEAKMTAGEAKALKTEAREVDMPAQGGTHSADQTQRQGSEENRGGRVEATDVPPAAASASPSEPPPQKTAEEQRRAEEEEEDDDDAPPTPQSAAPPANEVKELTRVLAPVAAARQAQPNRRDTQRRPPPPPTLYEKLTEEERLNEQGLLLQALRFFAARDFFQEKK